MKLMKKMIMIIVLVLAGICGGKVLQEVSIVRYAVFWYFLRAHSEIAAELEAYVFPRILYTTVCSLMTGIFLVVSFFAGAAILQKKTNSSRTKYLITEIAAIALTVLFGFLAVTYIRSLTEEAPFLTQIGSDIQNEYQVHIVSKVLPVAVFSFLTGVFIAVFFKFLRDLWKGIIEIAKEVARPVETFKPMEALKPIEVAKPIETLRPIEVAKPSEAETDALKMLKYRLAKGEITVPEFERMKSEERYCSNCGQRMSPDAKFCSKCGQKI